MVENAELKKIADNLDKVLRNQKIINANIQAITAKLKSIEEDKLDPMFDGLNFLYIREQKRSR